MKRILVMAPLALALVACTEGNPVGVTPVYDHATLEMKYQAVYDLIQDPACTDTPVCAGVGIGNKPCGGPWRYVVYSTTTVDANELATLVADLDLYETGLNQQEHTLSDCALAPVARPECVDQKCVDQTTVP